MSRKKQIRFNAKHEYNGLSIASVMPSPDEAKKIKQEWSRYKKRINHYWKDQLHLFAGIRKMGSKMYRLFWIKDIGKYAIIDVADTDLLKFESLELIIR